MIFMYLDNRLIRIQLMFPDVCFMLPNQVFSLVALVHDHVIVCESGFSDLTDQIRHGPIALRDERIDLRVSLTHEPRGRPARLSRD